MNRVSKIIFRKLHLFAKALEVFVILKHILKILIIFSGRVPVPQSPETHRLSNPFSWCPTRRPPHLPPITRSPWPLPPPPLSGPPSPSDIRSPPSSQREEIQSCCKFLYAHILVRLWNSSRCPSLTSCVTLTDWAPTSWKLQNLSKCGTSTFLRPDESACNDNFTWATPTEFRNLCHLTWFDTSQDDKISPPQEDDIDPDENPLVIEEDRSGPQEGEQHVIHLQQQQHHLIGRIMTIWQGNCLGNNWKQDYLTDRFISVL